MNNLKNEIGQHSKSRTLNLGLAAVLLTTGLAMANHGEYHRGSQEQIAASGHVEVVHQVPGGTISVGVEIGRPRTVVVQPQPSVVVVEPECHRTREVTVIHEEPRREVEVIRTEEHGHGRGHGWGHREVVVVHDQRERPSCDRHEDWREEGYRRGREEDFRRDWLDFNAPYLLWPYARAYIANLTGSSSLPPLTIFTMKVPHPPIATLSRSEKQKALGSGSRGAATASKARTRAKKSSPTAKKVAATKKAATTRSAGSKRKKSTG